MISNGTGDGVEQGCFWIGCVFNGVAQGLGFVTDGLGGPGIAVQTALQQNEVGENAQVRATHFCVSVIHFGDDFVLIQCSLADTLEIEFFDAEIRRLLDDRFEDVRGEIGEVLVFRIVVQGEVILVRQHEHGDPIIEQSVFHAKRRSPKKFKQVPKVDFSLFCLIQKVHACRPGQRVA